MKLWHGEIAVSPTFDKALVDAAHGQLLDPAAWEATPGGKPGIGYVAEIATQYLQEQTAAFRADSGCGHRCGCTSDMECPHYYCGCPDDVDEVDDDEDFDPTDAELEVAWNGPGAPEVHRAAWALHQELHS